MDTRRTVNVADIKEAVKQSLAEERQLLLTDFRKIVDERFSQFEGTISQLEKTVDENANEIDLLKTQSNEVVAFNSSQKHELDQLKAEVELLISQSDELKTATSYNNSLSDQIMANVQKLEERVEERTNRQMRKTLVFKGISEINNEKWEDTREILAETISKNVKGFSYDDAYDTLDRVHRGPQTQSPRQKGKRDIFAALHNWDDCEFINHKI